MPIRIISRFANTEIQQIDYDSLIGIELRDYGKSVLAYLVNFKTITYHDGILERSGVLCYFHDGEGNRFKCVLPYNPYFYVDFVDESREEAVRKFIDSDIQNLQNLSEVEKIDLDDINHMEGFKKRYLKLEFRTVKDLMAARSILMQKTQRQASTTIRGERSNETLFRNHARNQVMEVVVALRQYDIPYHTRACIDLKIRAGKWFEFDLSDSLIRVPTLRPRDDQLQRPDLRVFAFDIETSKETLKFPDANKDVIMMISVMIDEEAYLIINRDFCGQDVSSFTYQPKRAEFTCEVTVFNEPTERDTLLRFFRMLKQQRVTVLTSFNGDRFDIPFIHTRCRKLEINFYNQSGLNKDGEEYYGQYMPHLDCYYWVDRDAYLPQGSHGLKAVTKAKLDYEPTQVQPEMMVAMARENTAFLAEYSVSDAVATFHLYMKHIHDFIFALCTIIPMSPDEVLRKGSGTLCQNLLMAEAFNRGIIMPNKKMEEAWKKYENKYLIDTETYTGGKVECLRTGVYRADFDTDFQLDPSAFQDLINDLDQIIKFTIEKQAGKEVEDCVNFMDVHKAIREKLEKLRDVNVPRHHMCKPLIYHLDVAAMYPNIILTNRLQPVAVVNDSKCQGCVHNSDQTANCKRNLNWEWKAELYSLSLNDFENVREILDKEIRIHNEQYHKKNEIEMKSKPVELNNYKKKFGKKKYTSYNNVLNRYGKNEVKNEGDHPLDKFINNTSRESADYQKELEKRVKAFCANTYKKVHISKSKIRTDTVCMRENSFYVDTVRDFRDRRYEFKAKVKVHKGKYAQANKSGNVLAAKQEEGLMALYESLQLAHKIILNSFYGYVMRKGARWYNMETAAMVTHIGGNIISECKDFIEARIGKPLELDTDGIWLLLPEGFPESFSIKFKGGESCHMSYPCSVLNKLIYHRYKNDQYQTYDPQTKTFKERVQMSIAFEIDGPYKAMFIPAAKEKQKTKELDITHHNIQMLKKRYAVFNFKNQISQYKGFEMKRRGELNIVKNFQQEIFYQYLKGTNLQECYAACAETARKYLSIITKKGIDMALPDILEWLEESKVLSRELKDYGNQKGVAISCAKRLAEFLGEAAVSGKGLCCYFVISAKPFGKPVTERAIPSSIFSANTEIMAQYLRRWTGEEETDIRGILDWDYYHERLSTQIQKMVCIPALLQNINNPLPELPLPEWLGMKKYDERLFTQARLNSFVKKMPAAPARTAPLPLPPAPKHSEKSDSQNQKLVFKENSVQRAEKLGAKINPYSMNTQFSSWLKAQKLLWQGNVQSSSHIGRRTTSEWHLLQVVPESPGILRVWSVSKGKIQSSLVAVKRKYYTKHLGAKGAKKAPRSEGPVIENVIDEAQFIKQKAYYESIARVYEANIPLEMSFIINKGCICKCPDNSVGYQEDDLKQSFSSQNPYLEGYEEGLTFLKLIQVSARSHSVWGLFNPRLNQYRFVFVSKTANKISFAGIARKELAVNDAKIETEVFSTLREGLAYLNSYLSEFAKLQRVGFIVNLRSSYNARQLQELGLTALLRDVPVIHSGKTEDRGLLDALSWQQKLLKACIDQSKECQQKVSQLIDYARYSFIPICNLSEADSFLNMVSNIVYCRALRMNDQVLWWNDFLNEVLIIEESLSYHGRFSNPDLYLDYCFEIDIANLAICALTHTEDFVQQIETRVVGSARDKKVQSEGLDEVAPVQPAFELLKQFTKTLLKDLDRGYEMADFLLQNLQKWIYSQDNALYDPLLHRLIRKMSRKVFYGLMHKLRDFGFEVVYGCADRVIISSQKYTIKQAQVKLDNFMKKYRTDERQRFSNVNLQTLCTWRVLLLRDAYNYGGMIEGQDGATEYNQRWALTLSLSPMIAQYLCKALQFFIKKVSSIKHRVCSKGEHRSTRLMKQQIHALIVKMLREQFEPDLKDLLKYLIQQWEEYCERRRAYLAQKEQEPTQMSNDMKEEFVSAPEEHQKRKSRKPRGREEDDEEDEEMDDFIDDEEEAEDQDGKMGEERYQEEEAQWRGELGVEKWIENLFKILQPLDDKDARDLKQELERLRAVCLKQVGLQPLLYYPVVEPVFPVFQIPCPVCCKVNELPEQCSCGTVLTDVSQWIEPEVCKMIQLQAGDLYCTCGNNIMVSPLKDCRCGGRWMNKQEPLKWIPFVNRSSEDWEFVNRMFQFMKLC